MVAQWPGFNEEMLDRLWKMYRAIRALPKAPLEIDCIALIQLSAALARWATEEQTGDREAFIQDCGTAWDQADGINNIDWTVN